jgi:hypothetical protein
VALLAAVLIATLGYFNNQVVRANNFVGNHFPLIVFGPFVAALLLGGLLRRLTGRRWSLRGSELAVILTMSLAACNVPGTGMLQMFARNLAEPIQTNNDSTAWQKAEVLEKVRPFMLPNGGQYDRQFLLGFHAGMGRPGRPIGLAEVPWGKWAGPLSFWVPLALLMALASVSLAVIVHREWSQRERLKYPMAEFANTLLAGDGGAAARPILRTKLFWFGMGLLLFVQLINGLAEWFPARMIRIPRELDFLPLWHEFRGLLVHWQAWHLFRPEIWPIAVAFGFVIAADVSLSLGISQLLFILIVVYLTQRGAGPLEGTIITGAPDNWQRAGSCLALALVVVYTGRRHFRRVFATALAIRPNSELAGYLAWSCRAFILSIVGIVAMLCWAGLDWPLAVLFVVLAVTAYLAHGRINAESGLLLGEIGWLPSAVMFGLLGAKALGLKALAVSGLVGTIFLLRMQECLMPFALNALKISERRGLRPGRTGRLAWAGFAVALAAGVPFALWVDHNYGAVANLYSDYRVDSNETFASVERAHAKLSQPRQKQTPADGGAWRRLAGIRPEGKFLLYAGAGVALALAVSALRLRFARWPIHPIMFMVWGTAAMARLSASFLIGWIIRQIVTRVGGAGLYTRVKGFMYGVIAGELLGALIWLIVGAIYYAATGDVPKRYPIFPGG